VAWDPGAVTGGRLRALARLVRIEHTLFSLPFAYAGALLGGVPDIKTAVLIAAAVVGLRTAAMAYNNIADLPIDARNPRTRSRPLVVGTVSLGEAWWLVVLGSALYFLAALMLNQCAALLSPLLWLVAMSYPHAKRYHCFPHLHLGLTLGLVVLGGYVAVSGDGLWALGSVLASAPWIIVAAVALWVAGFDILYSTMDEEFDRSVGLGSVAACFGARAALYLSLASEAAFIGLLLAAIPAYSLGPAYALSVATASILEVLQFVYYRRGRLRDAFNVNLLVGLAVAAGVAADRLLTGV